MTKQPTFNEHELIAAITRESFADFVKEFWHEIVTDEIVWNWHMDVLCDELQTVAERIFRKEPRLYDLVINVPPATTKSSICSVMFPAWLWTRMPHCRVIGASYSYSLAVDLSRKCRDIVKSEKYKKCFPKVLIREDQDAKGYFVNSRHGDRFTASVNGMVTGMHGHIIIVDDPLDPEQAFSEAELKIANRWMTHTLPSRKVDKSIAPVILVQQRLHANDPSGEMIAKSKQPGGFPVRHIRIPADNSFPVEPPELVEKYANGLMDPRRLPRVVLDAERANSEYTYRSQYGQDPQPAGGTMFQSEWFNQRVRSAPYEAQRILYIDRAATEGGGAYTAMVLMAKSEEGNFYVEHVVHGQWEPDKRNEKTRAEALRCRAKYHEREPVIWVEREGGSAGRDAWKGVARALAGFNVREDNVTGRKEVRAEPWAAQLSARNVFIVDDGTWDVNNYVTEHCLFPNGKFLDQVDASSGAFNLLTGMRRLQGIRVIRYSVRDKKRPLRLVVCTTGQLAALSNEGPLLVVSLGDLGHDAAPLHEDAVESMALGFPDLDPALLQDAWDQPLEAYDSLPEGVMLRKEQAKKVWAFLLKDRPAPPSSIVFCESESTNRAVSVALAVCDAFRLPRKDALVCDTLEDKMAAEAPNRHVYKTFRAARAYVAR
jgi:predicted phage terminase large subunit-like protein